MDEKQGFEIIRLLSEIKYILGNDSKSALLSEIKKELLEIKDRVKGVEYYGDQLKNNSIDVYGDDFRNKLYQITIQLARITTQLESISYNTKD